MSKSEATKARLQHTALELFTEHGFDNVTVEQIATSAGTSHMTFYRHFPTKESVVLDDPYDPMIGHAIAAQDTNLPAVDRVRAGLLTVIEHMDDDDGAVLTRVRLAVSHRGLRARIWENNLRTEEVIVTALVEGGAPRTEAVVAAGAVLGAMTAALIEWAREDGPAPLAACLGSALSQIRGST